MRALALVALVVLGCAETPATQPPPPPPPESTSAGPIDPIPNATSGPDTHPIPPATGTATAQPIPTAPTETPPPEPRSDKCAGAKPHPTYVCARGCGPPVARPGDPPPPMVWAPPERVRNGQVFPCPICLPPTARIATPHGALAASDVKTGMLVYTVDAAGRRVSAEVLVATSTWVGKSHHVEHVVLDDGRELRASGAHPTADGRRLDALHAGDRLDGSIIVRIESVPLDGDRTFDLLPSGPTGAYWADGVLVGSTLANRRLRDVGRDGR